MRHAIAHFATPTRISPMNAQPDGTKIVHEIEIALARCTNRDVSALSQSIHVIDFMDKQRHRIEQGQWTPTSFLMDRAALCWSKAWRSAPIQARAQVSDSFSSMGTRIKHAEQMKSIWAQVQDVKGQMVEALPDVPGLIRNTVDLAERLIQRRQPKATEPATRGPAPR